MSKNILEDLVKLADALDRKGLIKEADELDSMVMDMARDKSFEAAQFRYDNPELPGDKGDDPEYDKEDLLFFLSKPENKWMVKDLLEMLLSDIHDADLDALEEESLKKMLLECKGMEEFLLGKYKDEVIAAYEQNQEQMRF